MQLIITNLLFYFSLFLVLVGIAAFLEIKSYQRQGKHWIWYKRPSAIAILIVLIVAIGSFLFFIPIATISVTDIEHLSPFSKGLRVLIAMIGVSIALIGGGSLALYCKSLIEKETLYVKSQNRERKKQGGRR